MKVSIREPSEPGFGRWIGFDGKISVIGMANMNKSGRKAELEEHKKYRRF
jgi:hypothetical protein